MIISTFLLVLVIYFVVIFGCECSSEEEGVIIFDGENIIIPTFGSVSECQNAKFLTV